MVRAPVVTAPPAVAAMDPVGTAPPPSAALGPALLLVTPSELVQWQKLCRENPRESPESCLERLRLQLQPRENAGAAPATPRMISGGTGGDHGEGAAGLDGQQQLGRGSAATERATVKASSAEVGEKRKKKQADAKPSKKRVKVEVEVVVSDEEAKALIRRMHVCGLEMVNAHLPGMSAMLPQQKKQWKEYKKTNGGDFSKAALLTLLVRSSGRSRTLYDGRVRDDLVALNTALTREFYAVFPTFEVLRGRMSKLRLDWPKWWPQS